MSTPILITTCTKSKSMGSLAYIPHEHPLFRTQDELLEYWTNLVQGIPAESKVKARALYTGRSFKRALMAADEDSTRLYIISAGLGLVNANELVTPYELTTSSAAPNRVSKQIAFGGFSPSSWWSGINKAFNKQQYPIAQLVKNNPDRLIVLCLSKEYLKMILDDIATVAQDKQALQNIRVIGSDLDELLPVNMFDVFMPYDLRMNVAEDMMPGSRIDFSIRAAIHFITSVASKTPNLEEQKQIIRSSLDQVGSADVESTTESRGATDEEIIDLIVADLPKFHGRKMMHLRTIREVHHVRCSQQRFDRLFPVAKSQAKVADQSDHHLPS